jgi:DNA mismatch endonuclease (patch repair protein)
LFKWPNTNTEFWRDKIHNNISNDSKNTDQLLALGWRVFKVWECSIKNRFRHVDEVISCIVKWLLSDEVTGECKAQQTRTRVSVNLSLK